MAIKTEVNILVSVWYLHALELIIESNYLRRKTANYCLAEVVERKNVGPLLSNELSVSGRESPDRKSNKLHLYLLHLSSFLAKKVHQFIK